MNREACQLTQFLLENCYVHEPNEHAPLVVVVEVLTNYSQTQFVSQHCFWDRWDVLQQPQGRLRMEQNKLCVRI
jgi:hypothetical protein